MHQRFREIAEANHRLQHPFTVDKIQLLGKVAGIAPRMNHLDLSCGNGELLVQWAAQFNIYGVGIDTSEQFIQQAQQRADDSDVLQYLTFVVDDPLQYPSEWHEFDVVSALGGDMLAVALPERLNLLKMTLRDHSSLIILGDSYWVEPPSAEAIALWGVSSDLFYTLPDLLTAFEEVGAELVEMVIADRDDWDRYESQQWMAVSTWLNANPTDPDSAELRQWMARNRRNYLTYARRYLGWGAFVLRVPNLAPSGS
jgi:hypothetical protein